MEYCKCELPIRITKKASDSYKVAYCATCLQQVDPESKAINKKIQKLVLKDPTRNEVVLQSKINEVLDLIKANGGMIS